MSKLTFSPAWQALQSHHSAISQRTMREMFQADPGRFKRFSLPLNGLLLDYSKNLIVEETQALLIELARQSGMKEWIARMFNGEKINTSEQRAVLHTALRAPQGTSVYEGGRDVMPDVLRVRQRMRIFSDGVRSGAIRGYGGQPFRDIVSIGIGGSALGPLMVCEALKPFSGALNAHFVSNVDATDLAETLKHLTPQTTLFIVSSKTFTTQASPLCAN